MRKTVLALVGSAALLSASGNTEITVVGGGVHPFDNSEFKDHVTYGVRLGLGVESFLLDQLEIGYDYSDKVKYIDSTLDKIYIHRGYLNGIKEFKVTSSTKLYALVGVGWEDLEKHQSAEKDGAFGQYGLGIKQYIADSFIIRAEARHAVKLNSHHKDALFYSLGIGYSFGETVKPVVVQEAPAQIVEEVEPVLAQVQEEEEVEVVENDETEVTPIEIIQEEEIQGEVVKKIILTNQNLNFGFDSAAISAEYEEVLHKVSDDLISKEYSDVRVLVGGHTDSTGTEEYNIKLSLQRANAVKDILVKYGVSEDRIITRGYGFSKPIRSNGTSEGRSENRRSEILFVQ